MECMWSNPKDIISVILAYLTQFKYLYCDNQFCIFTGKGILADRLVEEQSNSWTKTWSYIP